MAVKEPTFRHWQVGRQTGRQAGRQALKRSKLTPLTVLLTELTVCSQLFGRSDELFYRSHWPAVQVQRGPTGSKASFPGSCGENLSDQVAGSRLRGVHSRPETEFRGGGRVMFLPGRRIIGARSSGCTMESSRFARYLCRRLDRTLFFLSDEATEQVQCTPGRPGSKWPAQGNSDGNGNGSSSSVVTVVGGSGTADSCCAHYYCGLDTGDPSSYAQTNATEHTEQLPDFKYPPHFPRFGWLPEPLWLVS